MQSDKPKTTVTGQYSDIQLIATVTDLIALMKSEFGDNWREAFTATVNIRLRAC